MDEKSDIDTEQYLVTIADREIDLERTLKRASVFLLLLVPFILGRFYTGLFTQALIFAIFALSVDLLWGYSGVLTFGHAAFFGIGAYSMAKVLNASLFSGADYFGLVIGVVLAGFSGLIIAGVLYYRDITEAYFTIITLVVAVIAQQATISLASITGGYNGLAGLPNMKVGFPFVAMFELRGIPFYYAIIVIVIGIYLLSRRIVRSPFGTTLIAINENPQKARALGYNTAKYKALMFGISSAIAGLAGALYASYSGFVAPGLVGFLLSTEVLIWVLVGGRGTLIGAILGTVSLTIFESVLSGIFAFTWTLLLGIIFLVIVLAFPEGLLGVLRQLYYRLPNAS